MVQRLNEKTQAALDKAEAAIAEKYEEFKEVKGMEEFVAFLIESKINIQLRLLGGELDEGWLNAVCLDIRWKERHYKAEAGLLSPEEMEARKRLRDFLNLPCDLPPEVNIKIDTEKLEKKRKLAEVNRKKLFEKEG